MFELIQAVYAAENAAGATQESGVAGVLGINLKLFVAQLINFAIVFFILWKLVFKNIIKTIGERQKTIERSIADAKKNEEIVSRAAHEYEQKMLSAHAQARAIIKDAEDKALKSSVRIKEQAKEEIALTLSQARNAIKAEKEQAVKESKALIAELVVQTTEKILREKITDAKDKRLIEKMIE